MLPKQSGSDPQSPSALPRAATVIPAPGSRQIESQPCGGSDAPFDFSLSRDELLHQLFESQVDSRPDHVAVICGDERLTYADLDHRANQLARHLRAAGAKPGAAVGFLLPRSSDVYVTLLAILKTGAAYVPLDPEYPADRVAYILADCQAVALVTTSALSARDHAGDLALIQIDTQRPLLDREPSTRLSPSETLATRDDVCYVIYTSGSTGRPKGVEITHRSACNLVRAEGKIFGIVPTDRVYQGFSIAFDASVEEVWLALFAGAALVCGTADMVHAGPALSGLLADAGVTVLSCVPTLLSIMRDAVPTLRLLILGGEACPQRLVQRWCKPGCRMVNTYGPTEATVIATYSDLQPDRPVTIGRAVPNYELYVLDEQMQRLPVGEAGELHIGGVGLARGYVGRADLTAEKFVQNPFSSNPKARLYKSGDLVKWNPEGELEFLGRIDTQVKLRGFRIELAEIESSLMQCPGVQSAVVAVREDLPGVQQLVGYVIPSAAARCDEESLHTQLRSRLPTYMVPALIEIVDTLPTLPSGKVDRKCLPAPAAREVSPGRPIVPPRTPRERTIAAAWARFFRPAPVSLRDDFFMDLGGHSLLAAGMVSELRETSDFADMSVLDVYRHPTVEKLAAEFDARHATSRRPSHRKVEAAKPPASTISYLLCVLGQIPGLYIIIAAYSVQWLAPYLAYNWLLDTGSSVLRAVASALLILFAINPALLLLSIISKWSIIGRYKPGQYPLWGWYYLRWWFVQQVQELAPLGYLEGTPLLNWYYRAMGAKIGRNVHFGGASIGMFDVVSVSDHTSVGADVGLRAYTVENGTLTIGPIDIGRNCFVGVRSILAPGTRMGDGSSLDDLSLLPSGGRIPPGQRWIGSPAWAAGALNIPPRVRSDSPRKPALAVLAYAMGFLLLPFVYLAALLPGMALVNSIDRTAGGYWFLLFSPVVGLLFVLFLALQIAGIKWLLLGRVQSGRYRVHSGFYVRKWMVDQLMSLSLDVLGPMYATLYLNPWYKLLGAKLGKNAEISTACSASPDLLDIGDEGFIADAVSLGAPRVDGGWMTLAQTRIGKRAFVGNSAAVPGGAVLAANTLIGVLSTPPLETPGATVAETSWLGSPPIYLPQRQESGGFSDEATFNPTPKLYRQRYAIEFLRIALPATGFVFLSSLLIHVALRLRLHLSLPAFWLLFPLLFTACGVVASLFAIAAKWALIGRYKPCERPLWSPFVWRTELVTALHEGFANTFLIDLLAGTPWVCWFFRLMGAKIGSRVFLATTYLTEFDLIRIGDDATLNDDCTIQTHLFEDRVMKMSTIDIGPRCSAGAGSVVLYDTRMEPGAVLGDLSLLMKGESLPAGTRWEGTPARKVDAMEAPASADAKLKPRSRVKTVRRRRISGKPITMPV